MRTFAYCARSFEKSVTQAAGVRPLISPPATHRLFDPAWISGQDFLYFKLHGLPGQEFWYGDNWTTAISADLIRQADLANTIVFVANCHLYQIPPKHIQAPYHIDPLPGDKHLVGPMLTALLKAGARCIVGGPGENFASKTKVEGADFLGRNFRIFIQIGISPKAAFKFAKSQTKLRLQHTTRRLRRTTDQKTIQTLQDARKALKDTLEFRLLGKEHVP